MFQGMARGKVGDVVFYRNNGQQCSRVRNRAPRNPNTQKQLVQRAIQSNIIQMYSAGKALFDHSFQGKAVGAENQREFMKTNMRLLRSFVVADLNSGAAASACKGRVGARGINVASPFEGCVISKGTYDQGLFTYENNGYKLPAPVANEKIAEYAVRVGLVADDLYTFVGFGCAFDDVMASLNVETVNPSGNYDRLYNCKFDYLQLKVKASIFTDETVITADTKFSAIFDEYKRSGEPLGDELKLTESIGLSDFQSYADTGCIGLIRSREFEDLRSNSSLNNWNGNHGFTSNYLLDVWNESTSLQGTALILEGSNFNQAEGSVDPTLPEIEATNGFYSVPVNITVGGNTFNNPVIDLTRHNDDNYVSYELACDYDDQGDTYQVIEYNNGVAEAGPDFDSEQALEVSRQIQEVLRSRYSTIVIQRGLENTTVEDVQDNFEGEIH